MQLYANCCLDTVDTGPHAETSHAINWSLLHLRLKVSAKSIACSSEPLLHCDSYVLYMICMCMLWATIWYRPLGQLGFVCICSYSTLDYSLCVNPTAVIPPSTSSLSADVDQSTTQPSSMYDTASSPVPMATNNPENPGNKNEFAVTKYFGH